MVYTKYLYVPICIHVCTHFDAISSSQSGDVHIITTFRSFRVVSCIAIQYDAALWWCAIKTSLYFFFFDIFIICNYQGVVSSDMLYPLNCSLFKLVWFSWVQVLLTFVKNEFGRNELPPFNCKFEFSKIWQGVDEIFVWFGPYRWPP